MATETGARCVPFEPPTIRLAGKGARPTIRLATILGMLATAALLGVVSATAGLGVAGWIAGLATGSAATALLVTARMRSDQPAILPADWVTLTRTLLIAGVAGLVADSFGRPVSMTALVTLSSVALALDAVDGQVARRTGTATPLGARIDGEVDAFLILLLSIAVSQDYGSWVLVIGAARYALLLAGWLIPWLAAPLPPRFWRKVVAAVQGIVLTVAASGVPSRLVGMIAVAAALLLLAESFGRDVIWLYRTGAGPRTRRAARIAITGLALVILWFDLLAPDRAWQFSLAAFVRIPVEGLALVAVALVLPTWPRRIVADDRRNPVRLLTLDQGPQHGDSRGGRSGVQPGARLGQHLPGHRRGARLDRRHGHEHRARRDLARSRPARRRDHRISDSHHHRGRPAPPRHGSRHSLPSQRSGRCARACHCSSSRDPRSPRPAPPGWPSRRCTTAQAALSDQRRFEQAIHGSDPDASIPASDLLTGLRGKDVIIAFVESYGQVAVQGTSFSPGVDAVLRQQHRHADPRRLVHAERLAQLPDLRRHQLARPLHPAVGAVGQHPAAVQPAGRQQPVHPQRRIRQGRLAHGQRRPD